jgi:hypothetical protein
MCPELGFASEIEKCKKEAEMTLSAALWYCLHQEETCEQIAEDKYNEGKAICMKIDEERE